jgi:hypothetical protein
MDQRKQAKLQSFQNPNQMDGDNVNSIGHETLRTFRNKKGNI